MVTGGSAVALVFISTVVMLSVSDGVIFRGLEHAKTKYENKLVG